MESRTNRFVRARLLDALHILCDVGFLSTRETATAARLTASHLGVNSLPAQAPLPKIPGQSPLGGKELRTFHEIVLVKDKHIQTAINGVSNRRLLYFLSSACSC